VKIDCDIKLDFKTEETIKQVTEASRLGLRDTIATIANEAIQLSPHKTGNNQRSIFYGTAGMGHNKASSGAPKPGDVSSGADKSVIDESKLEAATYGTSGYSGFLETGTDRMRAQPYFRPALDLHSKELIPNIKKHLEART